MFGVDAEELLFECGDHRGRVSHSGRGTVRPPVRHRRGMLAALGDVFGPFSRRVSAPSPDPGDRGGAGGLLWAWAEQSG